MKNSMTDDFSYDPVTAVDEASATGKTAEIFADIRTTMAIPLVTSIWRGLASMGNSLEDVWSMTKPLYATDLPERALATVVAQTSLPTPNPLAPSQLACVGLSEKDLVNILSIIRAYNRSNGLNLVTLSAVTGQPSTRPSTRPSTKPFSTPSTYPTYQRSKFPRLLPQKAISAETWTMVRHVNAFGAPGIDANVATLWRHLAHWPALLALIHAGFSTRHASGEIVGATAQMTGLAQQAGAAMAHLLVDANLTMSPLAEETLRGYVHTPTQVVRMVTLGHTLERWLEQT